MNYSCNRPGTGLILNVLSDLALPAIVVPSCGCLGRCGAIANLVVVPPGSVVGHYSTSHAAILSLWALIRHCRNFEALVLREKNEDRFSLLLPSAPALSIATARVFTISLFLGDPHVFLTSAMLALLFSDLFPEIHHPSTTTPSNPASHGVAHVTSVVSIHVARVPADSSSILHIIITLSYPFTNKTC